MTWTQLVYGTVSTLALIDLGLVLLAIGGATERQTVGRLVALSMLLFGLLISATERLVEHASLTYGLISIVGGLVVMLVFLPMKRRK